MTNENGLKTVNVFHLTTLQAAVHISIILLIIISISLYGYQHFSQENNETKQIIAHLNVNDILFFDLRQSDKPLRPHEKYQLAKVVDKTGNYISLQYGDYTYPSKKAMANAIQFGQLSFPTYFQKHRITFTYQQLLMMQKHEHLYMAKRPKYGKLHGHQVFTDRYFENDKANKVANLAYKKAQALFANQPTKKQSQTALLSLTNAAKLKHVKAQTYLAEHYFMGTYTKKNLDKALYWLQQAAYQSYEPAMYKYNIICPLTKGCDSKKFYAKLRAAGVNVSIIE